VPIFIQADLPAALRIARTVKAMQSSRHADPPRIAYLDGWRGVAILMVLAD